MLGRLAVVSALLLCVLVAPASGQSLSCDLTAGGNWQPNEGPTDYNLHLSPQGTPSAVMVFVDFPDAPQNESTASLYNLLVPNLSNGMQRSRTGRCR